MARVERKEFATVVAYNGNNYLLGIYTPDSSYEWNPDIQTTTDVCGETHGDIEKSEPVQTFDPHYIADSNNAFDKYMFQCAMTNNLAAINGAFTVYLVALFKPVNGGYKAYRHQHCTIVPTSIGGEAYLGMPLEVHFSNEISTGVCTALGNGTATFDTSWTDV